MKVRTLCLAEAAYACISTPTRSMDVMLKPGRGAPQSLRESAAEIREHAARQIARAELMEQAADHLEHPVTS